MRFSILVPFAFVAQALATTVVWNVQYRVPGGGYATYTDQSSVPDSAAMGVVRNMGSWSSRVFSASMDGHGRVVIRSVTAVHSHDAAATRVNEGKTIISNNTPGGASVHHHKEPASESAEEFFGDDAEFMDADESDKDDSEDFE